MAGRPRRYRIEDVEAALLAAAGVRSRAALILDCSVQTVCNYIARSKRLQAVLSEYEEKVLDLAETGLEKHIKDGNLRAIMFYLRFKGRHRGYMSRTEVQGAPDGPPIKTAACPDLSGLSDDDLRQLRDIAQGGAAPAGEPGVDRPGAGGAIAP